MADPSVHHDDGADSDDIRVRILVSGLVQGVGYRYFAVTAARRHSITGWVRNLLDGRVELEAQGSRRDVASFLAALKTGTRWTQVSHVDVAERPLESGRGGFHVVS